MSISDSDILDLAEDMIKTVSGGANGNTLSCSIFWMGKPESGTELKAKAITLGTVRPEEMIWRVLVSDSAGQQIAEVTYLKASASGSAATESMQGAVPETPAPVIGAELNDRRRQIFEAACQVIAEKGFGNASVRGIAERAGMSVPLLYKHIRDKNDILELITSESMRDIMKHFESSIITGNASEDLQHAIETYIDYINVNRRYINLVYSELRSLDHEHREQIYQIERKFMKHWSSILDQASLLAVSEKLMPT